MKIKLDKRILAIALVFATLLAGFLSYYSCLIYAQDSRIGFLSEQRQNLNSKITNLTSQIPLLKNQITYFKTANLTIKLTSNEIITSNYVATKSIPYNYLCISGLITNTGGATAYNTGLHVIAYDASDNQTLDINMTVSLSAGTYGTDSKIDTYLTNYRGGFSSSELGSLGGGETVTTNIVIFHEGTVTNWTFTPVWTNTP